jgi:integrase/recombinase XerD
MCKTNRSGKSACLTRSQIERFCASLPEKYSLIAELMYFSAGRVQEITTIKVRNINTTDGLLTLEKSSTKTKETRQVPIPKSVMENLMSWIKCHKLCDDNYIFFTNSRNTTYTKGQKSVSTQSVDKFFRKQFDWDGIDGASTHSFRRSRLTHLLEKGWNLKEIMDISGHKDLKSLQQYLDSDKRKTHEKYRELFEEEMV